MFKFYHQAHNNNNNEFHPHKIGSQHSPDTSGTVNTTCHNGLHKWSNILILYCPLPRELVVNEATPVTTKGHRLVLQITLSTLVTDRAVKRVIHQEEFHYTFSECVWEEGIVNRDQIKVYQIKTRLNNYST